MVPAPTLTFAPTVASPRYDRWLTFEPAPRTVFFNSTKFPTFAPPRTSVSGRRWAKGQIAAPPATPPPTMTQQLLIVTWSPISESVIRTLPRISHADPIFVDPSIVTPG